MRRRKTRRKIGCRSLFYKQVTRWGLNPRTEARSLVLRLPASLAQYSPYAARVACTVNDQSDNDPILMVSVVNGIREWIEQNLSEFFVSKSINFTVLLNVRKPRVEHSHETDLPAQYNLPRRSVGLLAKHPQGRRARAEAPSCPQRLQSRLELLQGQR
jgi:hypothetical protein